MKWKSAEPAFPFSCFLERIPKLEKAKKKQQKQKTGKSNPANEKEYARERSNLF